MILAGLMYSGHTGDAWGAAGDTDKLPVCDVLMWVEMVTDAGLAVTTTVAAYLSARGGKLTHPHAPQVHHTNCQVH